MSDQNQKPETPNQKRPLDEVDFERLRLRHHKRGPGVVPLDAQDIDRLLATIEHFAATLVELANENAGLKSQAAILQYDIFTRGPIEVSDHKLAQMPADTFLRFSRDEQRNLLRVESIRKSKKSGLILPP